MCLNRSGLRNGGLVILLLLMIGVVPDAVGQGRMSKRGGTVATGTNSFTQPQLLNAATDPTLRYPIGSLVGSLCASMAYGWLDVSRTSIHFKVVQPLKRLEQGFDIQKADIGSTKIVEQAIRFRGGSKKYTIYYASEDRWESIHNCPDFWEIASLGQRGTSSILDALSNFDGVLAQVQAAAVPPPVVIPTVANPTVSVPEPKPAPATPPAILVMAPSGAGPDQVVDVHDSPMTIRGFTMDTSGIPVVKINDSPANMRPQSNQSAEFWSEPLPLKPGDNRMEISASNAAGLERKITFLVRFTPKPSTIAPKSGLFTRA